MKHHQRGAPALTHPQRQGTGAHGRACDTSPDAFDISRMAGEWGQGSLQPLARTMRRALCSCYHLNKTTAQHRAQNSKR